MTPRTVHIAAYDTLADWECGHAVGHLRSGSYFRPSQDAYGVVTVAAGTGRPVTTMGGQRIVPDLALDALRPEDSALLILPGAQLWDTGEELAPFARQGPRVPDAGVPVAAICGATAGLAREGLLDDRRTPAPPPRTSPRSPATGAAATTARPTRCSDGGLITAGPTEPVAFAREIFAELDVMEP